MVQKITKLISVALIIVGGFFVTPNAQALTLIPPSFETSVDPGVTTETTVKLYNETQDTLSLYPEVVSFTAEGETGNPTFDFDAPLEGAATWFTLPEGPIILDAGERKVIDVKITPPVDAEPGGHYATVFFGTTPPNIDDPGSLALSTKLGSLFLLRVFGDIEEAGQISQFGLDGDGKTLSRLPATLFTRFQNDGNIHLRPTGTITITNMLGGDTATLEFNPKKGATLPDTIRRYETVWEKGQVKEVTGNFWSNFWTEFSNEKNNFALGRYKANISLVAGNLVSDSAEISFWVMPWRVITVALVVLVLVVILLIFLIKKYNQWIITKARKRK
ncbi:hypothetical protein KKB10_02515 [Patescibacteria group bacterium]|nr:hypothetical protein [Patescibacteria group bacterium]MBU1075094.1 hypothetical protein [Patescibacteria group bacterium]MBU1952237.1 hypothetical protein [Patescibacteria group bacterium]